MSNQYYIQRNDKVRGPISEQKLRELHAEGKLRDTDLVSTRNDGGWKPVASVLTRPQKSGTPSSGKQISRSWSRTPVWIAASLVVIVIGVIGGWLAFRGGESPGDSVISEPVSPPQALAPAATIANEPIAKPLVRVQFGGELAVSIGWVSNGKLLPDQRKSQETAEFPQGTTSQLYISNIPGEGWEGYSLYPTLELFDADQSAQTFLKDHVVEVGLTPADLSAVRSGVLVTKVFCLVAAEESATAVAAASIANLRSETISSTELAHGEDPVAVAQQRGTVLGVFRMGNKMRNFDAPRAPVPPRASSDARSTMPEYVPPGTSSPQDKETVQFTFGGEPAVAVGWVSDKKLFRNQRYTPGRADFPQGFTTQLVMENFRVEGWKDVSLYPSLEVREVAPKSLEYLSHCTVRLEITQADLEAVRSNTVVTKVMYLTNAGNSLAAPNAGGTMFDRCATVSSVELGNTADPLAIAEQRGPIVAVFRMSNEQPAIAEGIPSPDASTAPGTATDAERKPPVSALAGKNKEPFHVDIPTDVEEFLKQQPELNQFVTSIPDEQQYQSNFRKALEIALKDSSKELSASRSHVLVVGRIGIPSDPEKSRISGDVFLLKGGYFLALCQQSPDTVIRFFEASSKPILIPVTPNDDRRVVVVGTHEFVAAEESDLVKLTLQVVDAKGVRINAPHVTLNDHPMLTERPIVLNKEVQILYGPHEKLSLQPPGSGRNMRQIPDHEFAIAPNGEASTALVPAKYRILVEAFDVQPAMLEISPAKFEGTKSIDLGQVQLFPRMTFRLAQMRSDVDAFSTTSVTEDTVVARYFPDEGDFSKELGSLRYELRQQGDQIALSISDSTRIKKVAILGTDPIETYKNIVPSTVDCKTLAELLLGSSDPKALMMAQVSREKSELEPVRRIDTEIRSEQLILKPDTTYLVKFESSWSLLRISDVETEKEFIRKGIENWGSSFADVFKLQKRFTGGTTKVGMNTAGKPLWTLGFGGKQNPLTDEDLRMISTLTGAVELHLVNLTGFSEQGLAQLGQCKGLELLIVGSLDNVNDAFLRNLEGAQNLHTLFVSSDRITDKGITSLEKLPQLRRLRLIEANVTDKGIRGLAELESLEDLSIFGGNIRGDGFAAFKNHKRLQYLELGNCKSLNERGVLALGDIPSLKVLKLSHTNIGHDIDARLKASRGDLLVSIYTWVDGVLDTPISARFEFPGETPLSEVLDSLSDYQAVGFKKLVFVWDSGDKKTAAKSPTALSQITVSNIALEKMTLRQALTEILASAPNHKLTFQVTGDKIVISPK